jgi:hypothetical protein
MMAIRTETNWTMLSLRWIARAGSLLSILLILLLFVGEGFHPTQVRPKEWVGLLFFPAGVVAGMIIAWWKEGVGAFITVASLLAFYGVYGYLLGSNIHGWAFITFTSPGFLFLLYWILSRPGFPEATAKS